MRLIQRVERLEAAAKGLRGSGDAVLLFPADVADLLIERGNLGGDAEAVEAGRRIDAILASHGRAVRLRPPKPMSPAEAHTALVAAGERENAPDAEQHRRERLGELMEGTA